MSVVIPIRVPKNLAQKINELVNAGLYSSRSDLIREALRRFIVSERALAPKTKIRKDAATLASTMIAWTEKTVTDVILFGSTARKEDTAESDIDLLVLVENAEPWIIRQHLYDLVYPIIPALGVDISLIVMNRNRFAHIAKERDPFALSVISEGIQLQGDFLNEYNKSTPRKSN